MNTGAEVIVVGAGPVGLTAALTLARAGVDVEVWEALAEPSTEWRASTFHPPTLEMAQSLGISGSMLDQGLRAERAQYRDRHQGLFAEFDLTLLQDDTDFPFRLQLEQYKYVRILLDALRDASVPVHFGRPVEKAVDNGDTVTVAASSGQIATARWLIAADGARSTIRQSLDVPFEGTTYEHRYLVVSIDYPIEDVLPGICEVNYVADPEEHLLLLRVPDLWRVVLSVASTTTSAEATSATYVRDRLRLLVEDKVELPITEAKVYSIHQRVAQEFRHGRQFLVGDAAHINSPMGGMGLNSGIHDAFDLGTQLASVLSGARTDVVLDEWAQRRRTVSLHEIRRATHANTTALAEQDEHVQQNQQRTMAQTAGDPVAARDWLLEASMIANVRRHSIPGYHEHRVGTSQSEPDTVTQTKDGA